MDGAERPRQSLRVHRHPRGRRPRAPRLREGHPLRHRLDRPRGGPADLQQRRQLPDRAGENRHAGRGAVRGHRPGNLPAQIQAAIGNFLPHVVIPPKPGIVLLHLALKFSGGSMRFFAAAVTALICTWSVASAQGPNSNVIRSGSTVSLEYTLTSDDGQFTESNKGKEPLRYVDGREQIIPGLEKALEGLPAGAEKKVTVKPEDGYGQVDPKNFQEVPKEAVPADSLQVGTTLVAQN